VGHESEHVVCSAIPLMTRRCSTWNTLGPWSVGFRLFHVEHLTALRALGVIPAMERRTGASYSAPMFHVEHCFLFPLLLCDVPRGTLSPLWSYLECSTWNSCAAVFLL
jgi:hypothetical protein